MEKIGCSLNSVYVRAVHMRANGVPLKEMRTKFDDWASLTRLAESLLQEVAE